MWRGAPHTAEQSTCVSMGCPPPSYIKKGGGEGRPAPRARPKRGILLGLQVLVGIHQEGEGEGKRGRALVLFGLPLPGGATS